MKTPSVLSFSEEEILEGARMHLPTTNILLISSRQALGEFRLKWLRKVDFRHGANARAVAAYENMTLEEFDAINARQRWANWRTIPRNLSGRIPNRPLRVIDLCCGIGQSTEVLAYYLPAGSSILGLEYNAQFVGLAKKRIYRDATGSQAPVSFRAQSVLDPFGVEAKSIDLVNCSGAIGSHFDPQATEVLLREIARVTHTGSVVMLDCGAKGTDHHTLVGLAEKQGFEKTGLKKSHFLDIYPQVCFVKKSGEKTNG